MACQCHQYFPPREAGGGAPPEGRWEGPRPSGTPQRCMPLHHASHGPPPPHFVRWRTSESVLAMHARPRFAGTTRKKPTLRSGWTRRRRRIWLPGQRHQNLGGHPSWEPLFDLPDRRSEESRTARNLKQGRGSGGIPWGCGRDPPPPSASHHGTCGSERTPPRSSSQKPRTRYRAGRKKVEKDQRHGRRPA